MTPDAFAHKWTSRRDDFQALGVLVDGARICDEVLVDFGKVLETESNAALTLGEAAARSGYSAGHLGRLVRQGTLPNAGRRNAPRIRASDLPVKATGLPADDSAPQFTHTSRRQVVRAIVGDREELTR